MGHEREIRFNPGRRSCAGDDLRRVAVGQRVVRIQIAMAQGMMGTPRPVCARSRYLPVMPLTNSVGATSPSFNSGTPARRMAVAKQPRMRHVLGRCSSQMLGHCAGELAQALRGPMRMLVHLFIVEGAVIAEVGRDIHHSRGMAGGAGNVQQRVDERRGGAMRRGAEHRRTRQLAHQVFDLRLGREARLRPATGQMREGAGHRLTGLAVRENARQLEMRVSREQAQQLPGHIAAALRAPLRVSAPCSCRPRPRCESGVQDA